MQTAQLQAGENPGRIYHFKQSFAPELRFEWHPGKKIVYKVFVNEAGQEVGEAIGTDVVDHGSAYNVVLIFLRGFKEGRKSSTRIIQ